MDDKVISGGGIEDNPTTNASLIDKMREELLKGELPTVPETEQELNGDHHDGKVTADEDAVADFIKSFGATGATPYKAYDWVVNIPTDMLSSLSEATTPDLLYGTICVDSESAYVFPANTVGHAIGMLR